MEVSLMNQTTHVIRSMLVLATMSAAPTASALDISFYEFNGTSYTSACYPEFGTCSWTLEPRFYWSETPRPPGTTTQWMTFTLYSDGYITNMSRFDHMGAAVRAYSDGARDLRGRAMIAGAVVDHPQGCNVGQINPPFLMAAQIESFPNQRPEGGVLYPESCAPPLADHTYYNIRVEANDAQYVTYWIDDSSGNRLYTSPSIHDPSFIDAGITGWWVGHVTRPGRTWGLHLYDVTVGWY
jgi:hypothetical protein